MNDKNNDNTSGLVIAKEAAASFGYTTDYITRLAREGKIVGKKIGRSWHVDPKSVRVFYNHTKDKSSTRRAALKEQRKVEYTSGQIMRASLRDERVERGIAAGIVPAVGQLTAVVALGMTVGMLSTMLRDDVQTFSMQGVFESVGGVASVAALHVYNALPPVISE